MAFVLDSSIACSWAFRDENHRNADLALDRIRNEEAIFVPSLFWYEVRNVLAVHERSGRIRASDTAAFLRDIVQFRFTVDPVPDDAEVLRLARRHTLSIYDAVYLELAMRKQTALATLDRALIVACKKDDVPLLGDDDTVPTRTP
ncbi:MAG: type II toxin-antitoxin system VapC family toxin [Acidobacteriaceae bacterium]